MSSSDTNRRIERIEAIEKEIAVALRSAGLAVEELSKTEGALPVADSHAKNFLRHLQQVETGLAEQIAYLGRVSSSTVCGNTPRLAELRFDHKGGRVADMQQRLGSGLAAASAKVTEHGCAAVTTAAATATDGAGDERRDNDDGDVATVTATPAVTAAADQPMDST